MESAGNDDGGLARRHVLRTPFSTSLECSKITFALNSARKQTTVVPARAEPRAPLALDRHPVSSLRLASPPFVAVLVHSFVPQHRSVSSISRRSTLIPLSLPPTHLCPLPSREPTRRLSRPAGGGGVASANSLRGEVFHRVVVVGEGRRSGTGFLDPRAREQRGGTAGNKLRIIKHREFRASLFSRGAHAAAPRRGPRAHYDEWNKGSGKV